MPGVRLTWDGKPSDLRGLALPLQVVEEIGVARANVGTFAETATTGDDGWRNRLIWGDNAHVQDLNLGGLALLHLPLPEEVLEQIVDFRGRDLRPRRGRGGRSGRRNRRDCG